MAGEGCVISGGKDAVVAMTNYGSGECMGKWNAHKRDITKVAYGEHSCQPYVFSACRDGAVVLWTPTDRMPQQQFQGHELAASGLVPSMDCVHLCTGSRDNTIRMWDVTTGKCLTSQHLAQNLITHVAWRSDVASFIAQSSEDKELKLWDSRDLSMICAFPKKQYIQMHCDISFDAQYCVTCSNGFNANGCELTVWDVRQRRMLREYYGHQQSTNCAIFGKDATGRNLLISVSSDHTVRLWSADGNELIWTEYIASGGSILTAAVRETEIAMIRNIVLVVLVAITIEAIENPDAEGAHAEYPLTRLGLVSHPYYPVWANFKNAFRKSYLTMEEELARFRTFVGHHKKIDQHNIEYGAGSKSYQVQMNQFGDMPTDEFRAKMNGFKPSLSAKTKRGLRSIHFANGTSPLPESVDWRQKGYVTKVKNQGNCGSCWSFSTTGALEGQQFKKTGKLIELSEQNLVDCDHENYGCDGGLMDLAFEYIQRHGINTESEYPYTARDGRCRFRKGNTVTVDNGFADLPEDDEAALEAAIANVGPISVAIDANQWSFQFYSQGVYDEPSCTEDLDHAVLAVGYGATEKGEKYYIVKNSWSEEWGEEGYILMSRRKNNQCGIAKMASYPLVQ